MSRYTVNFEEHCAAFIDWSCVIDPSDFLDCRNEDELYDAVKEYIISNGDAEVGHDVSLGDSYNIEFVMPQDFVEEWYKLKEIEE